MLLESKRRGIKPSHVIADSWYSSLDNLKLLRNEGYVWVMGLRKNRRVTRGKTTLEDLDIPEEGLVVHLMGYGFITVFRFVAKKGRTDYVGTNMQFPTREEIESLVDKRWGIEVYHRELKQTCGLECCQSRIGRAQRNHIGLSIHAWIEMFKTRGLGTLTHYEQKWNVVKDAIKTQLKFELSLK